METITSVFEFPLSLLILLPLSFALLLFFLTKRKSSDANIPPGSTGWPIIGNNIELGFFGPPKFISKRMKKYSPDVFLTSLLGEKMAFFCGPQGNKFVFSNEKKLVTSWWPKSIEKVLLFNEIVDDYKKEVEPVLLNFLRDIIKPEALKTYISEMDSMTRHHIDTDWAPYDEVKVLPLSRKYTFALTCKLFMGIEDPFIIVRLMKHFDAVTNGMISVPIDLPGTAYNRGIKGGKLFRDDLRSIIRMQRKEIMENKEVLRKDILARMLLHVNEDGRFMNEMEISNNIIAILIATYETTSIAITFILKHLAEHPHIYDEVLKEQTDIQKSKHPGETLCWEDIEKMKYTWNVIRESMRLAPPGQGSFREALTDFQYAGFTIPKGMKIFWNVNTTHNNPKYFPNPEKFDPSRFEGAGPAPYTYVPFGGGPKMCPGKEYARVQLLVFIHNFMVNFKLEKCIPDEKIVYRSIPVPVKGLPVRLYRHAKNK